MPPSSSPLRAQTQASLSLPPIRNVVNVATDRCPSRGQLSWVANFLRARPIRGDGRDSRLDAMTGSRISPHVTQRQPLKDKAPVSSLMSSKTSCTMTPLQRGQSIVLLLLNGTRLALL